MWIPKLHNAPLGPMTELETVWFPLLITWNYLFSCLLPRRMKTKVDISVNLMCSHVRQRRQEERGLSFKIKNSFVKLNTTAKMYYTVNQYACCCLDFHVFDRQGNLFTLSLWWHSLGFNVGMYVLLSHIWLSNLYCNSHFF